MKLILTTVALFAFYNVNSWGAFGSPECGKVLLNKGQNIGKEGSTLEGQWPWHVAIYQQRTPEEDPRYICGGTLVSKRHVITAAHCVTKRSSTRLDASKLTVYLGKHSIKDSGEKVQVSVVKEKRTHPDFDASTFKRDLAILELQDPITFSNWVQPACLWSESDIDLKNIVGQSGSVVSWTFNGTTGELNEEQRHLDMPVVSQETCIRSYIEFFVRFTSDSTYCAGSIQTCSGTGGGGMVFEKDGSWYLRGIASLSVAKPDDFTCDPNHYVIFADVAQSLPWIKENIKED